MTKIITILSFILTINAFGQEVNYEMKAIEYYINNIESDSTFHQGCDCVYHDYDTEKKLTVYDSSYLEINPRIAFNKLQFEWTDSLLWTNLKTENIQIQNDQKLNRIQLTKDFKDFDPNHYLIRFSERLEYKTWTIIEFNIKGEKICSGINYFFLFNEMGQVENCKMIIWCDSPG
ncbi:hypothetical protein [Brumimicrobium aurantiacum]|uniref:Uncharacterized protein n=1 Tax=Brumimicrobium aurantiacum TaxID=1737063 RepID=A0A3E1EU64_9FLAO|nr:hypothetical protein [Brumimicrobium aurantiacum]RFC53085.1 hypothetical protein DXU93_14895 [Brumimicrobium aurantiacum]